MIQDVSDQLFQVFSERMRSELESAGPQAATAPGEQDALDVGAIAAKAAGHAARRSLRKPALWVALGVAVLVYLLLR
jgi:hypothetical protein